MPSSLFLSPFRSLLSVDPMGTLHCLGEMSVDRAAEALVRQGGRASLEDWVRARESCSDEEAWKAIAEGAFTEWVSRVDELCAYKDVERFCGSGAELEFLKENLQGMFVDAKTATLHRRLRV